MWLLEGGGGDLIGGGPRRDGISTVCMQWGLQWSLGAGDSPAGDALVEPQREIELSSLFVFYKHEHTCQQINNKHPPMK